MQQLTGDEVKVIALAAQQGVDYLPALFHGKPTTLCGTCGRMIHHPDCAQVARERMEGEDDDD